MSPLTRKSAALTQVVVLAAGAGKRMVSDLPKVLHPLGGVPMLQHVLTTAAALAPEKIVVVVGHGKALVEAMLADLDLPCAVVSAEQARQLGTGDAVRAALPHLSATGKVLVLYGDVPLMQVDSLRALLAAADDHQTMSLLTAEFADPSGYGRIVRDDHGQIAHIVEDKDASPGERAIGEINTGFMAFPAARLGQWLDALDNDNAQGEYYLTDLVAIARADAGAVASVACADPWQVTGVNSKGQLAALERVYQRRGAERLLVAGVTLLDPERIDIRGELHCGRDVTIDVGCVFSGKVSLGDGVRVGPYCLITNADIGNHTRIEAMSHLDGCQVGANAVVGPYARLRPQTFLADRVHIGNFVEIKKSSVGNDSKANHLSYIGDAEIGSEVNIGAGTITCNYDGVNKYTTIIEDKAFIGSDSQLVAPVRVGRGATLGAGTTLTQDAPAETLTLSRTRQTSIASWRRPDKTKP